MSWTGMLALAAAQEPTLDRDLLDTSDLMWRPVHDSVMGGRSTGEVVESEQGVRFQGQLSLENSGGFASMRGESRVLDLHRTEGLQLEVEGDGRPWFVTVDRSDVRLRAGSYRASIQTRAGEVTTHNLRWTEFLPKSFGRPVVGVPGLGSAPERIVRIGLMVSDGLEGGFDVLVRAIRPLAPSSLLPEPGESGSARKGGVANAFMRAIEIGVPAFNRGDAGVCRAHYQTVIETMIMLSDVHLSESQAQRFRAALGAASTESDVDAAWTLRRAIDNHLETLAGA
ncbi:MAG: hypothetical protein CL927_08255 [Deltaproteobacteria bacterium]|nr:hypothetical protein [Deltaproteobacteria bacterium]